MRLLVLLSCAFLLGWVLSWMYYASATNALDPLPPDLLSLPPSSPGISRTYPSPESDASVADTVQQAGSADSALDLTRQRLQAMDFEILMAEYASIQRGLSEQDSLAHKKLILDYAETLRQTGRPDLAGDLLGLYLEQEFRDLAALLLMARVYQDTGNEMEAIELLFVARSYAYTSALIEQTDRAIRRAVDGYDEALLARQDYLAQLNLYKRLTELEPEYTRHFIGLAESYLALGNTVDARKALALTAHDSSVLALADDINRRIEAELATEKQYAAEVALQPLGNQFLVDVVLNDVRRGVLLLDTGASLSIVSPELLQSMGVDFESAGREAWFSTAGGRIKAPIVTLDSLALGEVAVTDIEVGVIGEFAGSPFDGLLGMNFLRHFEFFIDQNQARLQLSPN